MLTKAGSIFCTTLNKPSHNYLRLLKYSQNCKISSNLVILVARVIANPLNVFSITFNDFENKALTASKAIRCQNWSLQVVLLFLDPFAADDCCILNHFLAENFTPKMNAVAAALLIGKTLFDSLHCSNLLL